MMALTSNKHNIPDSNVRPHFGTFFSRALPETIDRSELCFHDRPNPVNIIVVAAAGVMLIAGYKQEVRNPCTPAKDDWGCAWLKAELRKPVSNTLGEQTVEHTLVPAETIEEIAARFDARCQQSINSAVEYVDADIPVNYAGAIW